MANTHGAGSRGGLSIVAVITALFALTAALSGLAALYLAGRVAVSDLDARTEARARQVSAALARSLAAHLDPIPAQTGFLASRLSALDLAATEAPVEELLYVSLAAAPQISSVALVDQRLRLTRAFRNRPEERTRVSDWSDDAAFAAVIRAVIAAGKPRWGDPFFAESSGETLISHFAPFRDAVGAPHVIVASVTLSDLSRFLADLGREVEGVPFILRAGGEVVAHPAMAGGVEGLSDATPLPRLSTIGDPRLATLWAGHERDGAGGFTAWVKDFEAERDLLLYQTVTAYGPAPWRVGGYFEMSRFSPDAFERPSILLPGAALIAVAVLLALALSRMISLPISRIAAVSRKIDDWDLSAPPDLPRTPFRDINDANEALRSAHRALTSLQLYLPSTLPRKILESDAPLAPQSQVVTVLFTDIVGYTALAEDRDPAEVAEMLNGHFGLISSCIWSEAGAVDKFIGDSVMAFWGGIDPDQDHAAHACRAALAIREAVFRDNLDRRARGLAPIRVRVGIHTGEVIVGNIGGPARANFTVIGDTVNTAKRLESLSRAFADPDEEFAIVISGDTAARLGNEFELTSLGEREVYGRHDLIGVYRLEFARG